MVTLRVYLTGSVALEDGTVLVSERAFPGRQGRLAFAVLAWRHAETIPAAELADIVWDGEPPAAWQTALRAILSKLRGALGSTSSIEHALGCYRLRLPADAWIDVEAASAAVHEAEIAFRDGDLERSLGSALVANAIARRPFLAGDDGDWTERRRAELLSVRVRALETRGSVLLANGDAAGAATDAEIVTVLEPYRETAHALLMRAHVAAGNPAEALAAYERLRTTLDEDLGTRPTAETEAVFLGILSADAR